MTEFSHAELKRLVYEGAKKKFVSIDDTILDRLALELCSIEKINASDYFLVYHKIVEICNKENILRTPARGTSGNSLVNYCLDITNLNPIEHNLVFERFINTDTSSWVDIDIDIPNYRRSRLVKKLEQGFPDYNVRQLAYQTAPTSLKKKKFNLKGKEYSIHPYTIYITNEEADNNLKQYISVDNKLLLDENYPMDLVLYSNQKYDIVGLHYLDKLEKLIKIIGQSQHPYGIDLNEPCVFEIFSGGDLLNIFQFNHESLVPKLKEFKPQSIKDLSIIFGLYRPNLKEKIPTLIRNKNFGYDDIFYNDIRVSEILSESYGEIVFDETYMLLMNRIAGFSINTADKYRRVLQRNSDSTKIEMIKDEFIEGCHNNSNLNGKDIVNLTSLVFTNPCLPFIKSHSISYATVAYWGAYYKTFYRLGFDKVFSKVKRPLVNKLEHF